MSYRSQPRRRKQPRNAAIFVDYNNLIETLDQTLPAHETPEDHVFSLLPALRSLLRRKYRLQPTLFRAYGDFSASDLDEGAILQALYAGGADPRFVASMNEPDVPVRLCLDAMETLLTQPEISTLVIVSGELAYVPLLRQIRERSRQPLLATLAPPEVAGDILLSNEAGLLDLTPLLGDKVRRSGREASAQETNYQPTRSAHIPFQRIDDPAALNTLEVIEEHFGQYDEVYLTPLLRKLSDIFDYATYDPKSVISDLEAAGAVRLEKRHGNPYDYTVLIVMREHPDVQIVQRQYYEDSRNDPSEDGEADAPLSPYLGSDGFSSTSITSVDGHGFSRKHRVHEVDGQADEEHLGDRVDHEDHEAYSASEDGDGTPRGN